MEIDLCRLTPGFVNPTLDSQRTFRRILEAMAHPGRIVELDNDISPPSPLNPGAASICLTLLDFETALWTDLAAGSAGLDWLVFHCGCRITDRPETADFALVTDPGRSAPLELLPAGDDEYPESSATLIVQVRGLLPDRGKRLSGPGIRDFVRLHPEELPEGFWSWRNKQSALYPLGVDVILASPEAVAALPRTTTVRD